MVKCKDILKYIDNIAPFRLACDWDNVGLLVGDNEKEIKKAIICIDNDINVVKEAIQLDADLIISHHPIMFAPIKRLTDADPQQRMIRNMCKAGVCHIAAHTNMDCVRGGLNDYLAEKLCLTETSVMDESDTGSGFGRFAKVEKTTLKKLIETCKENLNLKSVNYVGDLDKEITAVALNCGSGADILYKAADMGADVLITGDVKYTTARNALDMDIAVIDAGHYGTEIIFKELMEKHLRKEFPSVEFILSKADMPVLKTI